MRQKLAVIAAMLHQPELLVLDEPTTGVDPVSRSGLWWLIARAAAEGCAIVLATTYLDEAERCASVARARRRDGAGRRDPGRDRRGHAGIAARGRGQASGRCGGAVVAPGRAVAGLGT